MDLTAAQHVADQFSLGSVRGEPAYVARGAMSEVWRVEASSGRVAVKELFSWADYPDRPVDVDVQLAALEAGVRLPRPILADGSAVVEAAGLRYRAYEWVDLGPPLDPPVAAVIARDAGETLGRIHALEIPVDVLEQAPALGDHPVDEWYRTSPPKERLMALARAGMGEARPWAPVVIAMFGGIDELVGATATAGSELPVAPIVCHRDFGLDNVRPAADGRGLIVLDWENAGPLAADEELAAALLEFATGGGTVHDDAADAFLAGYARAGGTARLRGAPSFAMAVNTALNYARVLMEQSLEDDRHRDFADETLLDVLTGYLPNLIATLPALASR